MRKKYNLPTNPEIVNSLKIIGIDMTDLSPERPWTPDGIAVLIDYYKRGVPYEDMAALLNRKPEDIL